MKRAVIYGSTLASYCVEKFGTEGVINLSQEQIEARARQFMELVTV